MQGDSTDGVINGVQNGDIPLVTKSAGNALEPASISLCPVINEIKSDLDKSGAVMSMMSGSGSAVYGIFTTHKSARNAYVKLRTKFRETYIAKPV